MKRIKSLSIALLLILTLENKGKELKHSIISINGFQIEGFKSTKFEKFISKFKKLSFPFKVNTSCYSPDSLLNIPLEMDNDSTFLNYSGPAITMGVLPDTSRFYAVIYCTAAACYLPVLAVFSKDGNVISRKEISSGCGSDVGYVCSEILEIKSQNKITVKRMEETFKNDEPSKGIHRSIEKTIHTYTYTITKNGMIKVKHKITT